MKCRWQFPGLGVLLGLQQRNQIMKALSLLFAVTLAARSALAGDATVQLDLTQSGPALSPDLYGQFIEHLGRCVHGGLWAEELQDRKFLLALTNRSPWEVVKPPGANASVFLDPAGHVLALYRAKIGGRLVPLHLLGDAHVDAIAAREPRSGILGIGLINYDPQATATVRLEFAGSTRYHSAQAWRIDGPKLGAINIPGQPPTVTTSRLPHPLVLSQPLVFPPHSITVLTARPSR